ncbi:MAG: hypothetical protein ISP90_05585 [Nevskia sp.]|nr:hypothetical protein [Nevskia sp.]
MSEGGPEVPAAPRIHPADPALKRAMPALVALIVAIMAALGWWFYSYLNDLPMDSAALVRDSAARPLAALRDVLDGSALLLLLYGAYLLQRQREVRSAPQYPPPHVRLFHDMCVLEGPEQRRYARRLARQGLLCLVLSAGLFGGGQYWLHAQAAAHPLLRQAPAAR